MKRPGKNYSFTKAQKRKWPKWDRKGVGIWILTAANQGAYDLLFQPPNWKQFWKAFWVSFLDIDALIDELARDQRNANSLFSPLSTANCLTLCTGLQRPPVRGTCLPTSFAMAMDRPVEIVAKCLGHDGSTVVWPDLPEPTCRAAFTSKS